MPEEIQIEQVFTSAETLPADWSAKIASVFGCKVKAFYGCGEIISLGYQDRRCYGCHVNRETEAPTVLVPGKDIFPAQ